MIKRGDLIAGDGWRIVDVQRFERPTIVESLPPEELVARPTAYRAVPNETWTEYVKAVHEVQEIVKTIKACPLVGLQAIPEATP